jgi:hypothetical protein
MQDHFSFVDLVLRGQDIVGLVGLLVFIEEGGDGLDVQVFISGVGAPLLADALEKGIEDFVEECENDALGVALADKGVGCDGLAGHLDVADLVFVHHAVSGVFGDAGEGLPDNKLEGVFGLVAEHEVEGGHLVVSVHDAYLLVLVLYCHHAGEDHHLTDILIILSRLNNPSEIRAVGLFWCGYVGILIIE